MVAVNEKPDAAFETLKGSRRAQAVIIIVIWIVLSLISATQRYADSPQTPSPRSFWPFLFWSLIVWSYWALAAPLIFQLGQWVSFGRQARVYATLVHFFLSFVLALLHIAIFAALGTFFGSTGSGAPLRFQTEFGRGLRIFLYVELVFYWAILGAGLARDSYRKFREREIRARELETQLGVARLQALKMQIQPHFLFNALNTVAMLIRSGGNSQAVQMVAGLGELLRLSLNDNSAQVVPLSSELTFVRCYLAIEEYRFPDRLRVEIDVPNELLTAEVPQFILQPLVENAIRHGLDKSSSSGLIRIEARHHNDSLELLVRDDGPGLPVDWQPQSGPGIGLSNTRARLEQLYGRLEFTIENAEPTGAVVRLRIPLPR